MFINLTNQPNKIQFLALLNIRAERLRIPPRQLHQLRYSFILNLNLVFDHPNGLFLDRFAAVVALINRMRQFHAVLAAVAMLRAANGLGLGYLL